MLIWVLLAAIALHADTPEALVQQFYEAYPTELSGGLPQGQDLEWLGKFISADLYDRFRSALTYQQEWIRRNPDHPPYYLKPPFADGIPFTGVPDVIGGFQVLPAEPRMPGTWHVPVHFWIDDDQVGWEGLVVVKQERARYVLDDIIFPASEPGEETWCISESLEWREVE